MTLGDLLVKVGVSGLPAFQTAMGGVSSSINKTFREADKALSGFDKLGDKMADVGRSLSIGITAPLALASGAALKLATDFDAAMRGVASVIGGNVTEQQLKGLSDQVLALSKSMGIDAVDAANAMKLAIGTGIPQENALEFLRVASIAAIGGLTDTSVVVDALTTVLAAYGLEASEAKTVTDKMAEAVRFGKGEFSDLASTIGPAASMAKNMGITFDDLLVSVATASVTSGSMAEAVTEIQSAMRGLNQTTPEMNKALHEMGFANGEAAVQAKGLTGILQALAEKTGGSTSAFGELFGRAEAGQAALALTGFKMATVAENTEAMKRALEGAGASQRAFDINNESMVRKLEKVKNEAKGVAIELGIALLPSLAKIIEAGKPLIGMLQGMVEWFTSLSPTTQQVTLGLLAVGAAIGPLLMIGGNLITVFSGIAKTFIAIPGIIGPLAGAFTNIATAVSGNMVGALTMGETMLLRMGQAALVAGIAFAGFKLGEWLYNTIPLIHDWANAISEQLLKIDALRALMVKLNGDFPETASAIKILEKNLTELGVQFSRGNETADQYAKRLRDMLETVTKHGDAETIRTLKLKAGTAETKKQEDSTKAAAKQMKEYQEATEKAKTAQEKLTDAIAASKDTLTKIEALYKSGKATMSDVIKASDDLKKKTDAQDAAFLKLHPTLGKVDTSMNSINEASWRTANVLAEQLNPSLMSSYTNFEKLNAKMYLNAGAWQDVMLAMDPLPDAIVDAGVSLDRLNGSMRSSKAPAYTLSDAIKEVGTKSPEEFGRLATAAEKVYNQLSESFPAASSIVKKAWENMMQAKIDYERSLGNNEIADGLQKQLDAHRQHGEKVETAWGRTAKQVSTIISDMGKNFASGIMKLFDNSENEKLDEQAQALRDSLAERTESWGEYKDGVNQKLQELQEDYDEKLEEQEQSLNDFISEQLSKQGELREKHQKELTEEVKDLYDSLQDKEDEYEDYAREVADKINESTAKHAEALDKELADLRDNLRDKIEEYDDYVDEANTKLRRIGEDTTNSIADESRSTKRKIDDKKKQYDRDAADTAARIAKLLRENKAGNAEEIANLQESLRRKAEDRDEYIRREEEDLADFIEEQKQREQRQTDDIKEQLDQRTRDHSQALTDIQDRQDEAIKKHNDALIKETKDLNDQLAVRKEALETARVETEEKINSVTAKHQTELAAQNLAIQKAIDERKAQYEKDRANAEAEYAKQTAALNTELGKALKEYDTYKLGVDEKLKALEDAHKGPLDRIGQMFKDVFKGAGEAVLRFAGEEVMGFLMGKLKGILDFIPGIGSAISGLFGGGGNKSISETAMGTLPLTNIFGNGALFGGGSGISSGAGSAIAGGAGGFLQIFNAVTGAVSAIANVLQLFGVGQGGQKDRLGQISDATTYVAKVYGDMGLKDSLQGMANNIAAYVSSHAGWVHESWVELLGKVANLDDMKWYADDTHYRIGEIRDSINSRLPELTAIKMALQTMPPPIVNVYVQGDLPNLVTTITTEITRGMALQGA